jgi:hypothetical protein
MLCASPPTRRRDRFRPLEDRSRRSALAKRRRREITTGAACGQPQQRACRLCLHNRIAKGQVRIDSISIAAPATLTTHVARLLQIAEHTVRIALGDLRSFCNLLDPQVRVSSNSKQHVRVTGEERPPSCRELVECTPLARFHRAELLAASQLPLNHQTVEPKTCFLPLGPKVRKFGRPCVLRPHALPVRRPCSAARRSPPNRPCAWARRNFDQLRSIRRGAGPRPELRNAAAMVVVRR